MVFKKSYDKKKQRLQKDFFAKIKKGDFAIAGTVFLLAAALWLVPFFKYSGESIYFEVVAEGDILLIYNIENGSKEFEKGDINRYFDVFEEEKKPDKTIISMSRRGINFYLVLKEGKIGFTDSDCPEQICVRTGFIEKPGEVAVCLPAGVFVRITGNGKDGDPDFVTG